MLPAMETFDQATITGRLEIVSAAPASDRPDATSYDVTGLGFSPDLVIIPFRFELPLTPELEALIAKAARGAGTGEG